MRIHALLMPRLEAALSPVMAELFHRLGRAGCDVTWSIGEEHAYEPGAVTVDHDLYLLKSQAPATLSLAGVLDALGGVVLNPVAGNLLAQDKVVASARMAAFGIRSPRTWVTAEPRRLASVVTPGPLVVKPYNGYHGYGVRFLDDASQLAALPDGDTALIVQERVQGADDLKVYCIGDDVFGVRKAFDANSHGRAGVPVPLSAEIVDLARRCGAAFGFGLWGIDVVDGPDGPVVIDVNGFPGYKGVPDAAERLCAYVLRYADGDLPLRAPALPQPRPAALVAGS